jgi:type II secretory pathway pseudopilin PulG
MIMLQAMPQRNQGFTLAELLVFICVISIVSLFAIPISLIQRGDLNQQHAQRYLQMIDGAQLVWLQQTGSYASLRQLATTVPVPLKFPSDTISVLRAPFLAIAPSLLVTADSIAHRGGYRFQLAADDSGNITGCWAWPNLNKYSGDISYYVDFATSKVMESVVRYSWKETPQGAVPLASELLVGEVE